MTTPSVPTMDAELAARFNRESNERSASVRAEFRHQLDLAYGSHPRNVLDVYFPNVAPTGSLLAFFHGGGFRSGDPKSVAFAGRPALEHGAIFVSVGYRLLPDAIFPATVADAEDALAWLSDHLPEFGGDVSHLVLAGHSVGAILAADAGLRNSWTARRGLPADLVKALVLVSGNYLYSDLPPHMVNAQSPRYVANLGEAIEDVPRLTVLAAGSAEQRPNVITETADLARIIRARGGQVEHIVLEGVDHAYAAIAMAAPDGPLAQATLKALDSAR